VARTLIFSILIPAIVSFAVALFRESLSIKKEAIKDHFKDIKKRVIEPLLSGNVNNVDLKLFADLVSNHSPELCERLNRWYHLIEELRRQESMHYWCRDELLHRLVDEELDKRGLNKLNIDRFIEGLFKAADLGVGLIGPSADLGFVVNRVVSVDCSSKTIWVRLVSPLKSELIYTANDLHDLEKTSERVKRLLKDLFSEGVLKELYQTAMNIRLLKNRIESVEKDIFNVLESLKRIPDVKLKGTCAYLKAKITRPDVKMMDVILKFVNHLKNQ